MLGALWCLGQCAEQLQAPARVRGGFVVGIALQRALPGGLPVGDGLRGQAGLCVVVCQQLGLRGNGFRERGFECLGDALMVVLLGALEQRLVGRVLYSRHV